MIIRRYTLPKLSPCHRFGHGSSWLAFLSHLLVDSFIIRILWLQEPETYSSLLSRKKKKFSKAPVVHRIEGKAVKSGWEGDSNESSSGG